MERYGPRYHGTATDRSVPLVPEVSVESDFLSSLHLHCPARIAIDEEVCSAHRGTERHRVKDSLSAQDMSRSVEKTAASLSALTVATQTRSTRAAHYEWSLLQVAGGGLTLTSSLATI